MASSVPHISDGEGGYICYQYNAPTVFLEAVALTILFVTIDMRNRYAQKVTAFLSSLVFGVYVLHSNCIFRSAFGWDGRWQSLGSEHPLFIVLHLVGITLAIFVVGCVIDFVRRVLFRCLVKVQG